MLPRMNLQDIFTSDVLGHCVSIASSISLMSTDPPTSVVRGFLLPCRQVGIRRTINTAYILSF